MAKVTIKLLLPASDGVDSKQDDAYDIYKMKEKFDMSDNVPTISVLQNHIVKEILSLSGCDDEEQLNKYFKKIKLRYLDEDGDFVVIRSDQDLIDAIESILENKDSNAKKISVKIYVRHSLHKAILAAEKGKTKEKEKEKGKEEENDKKGDESKDETKDDTKTDEPEPEPEIGPIGPSFVIVNNN